MDCPFRFLCSSPSKRENSWACSNHPHKERMKMCIEYVRAFNNKWIDEISEKEIFVKEK
jgi:hypothetical protein